MKTTRILTICVLALGLMVWPEQLCEAAPLSTAFTYKGHLYDANYPANGLYDFAFKLYDASVAGSKVGTDVNVADVDVIDAYFTVALDFNDPNAFNGDARWLEIGVRPGGLEDPNVYTVLSPRQEITPTPYAIYAKNAGSGGEGTVPGPGKLRCFKKEYFNCPESTWTTVCNLTDGPALVTNLWIASYLGGRALPIRITFDGEDPNYPHIIGLTGELFAAGFDDDVHFRNNFVGVSRGTSTHFSGFLKLLMPYHSSIRVDVYGGGITWFMLERLPVTLGELNAMGIPVDMHLRTYGYGQGGNKDRYSEVTLLETTSPTILAGLFQFIRNYNSNWSYVEGNIKIYYGASGTASYESSGLEDFYHSSWGFIEGPFAVDDECLAWRDTTDYAISVSRFFPLWRAPYHQNGIKLTWSVGEEAHGDPGETVYTRWIAWYYK